MKNTPGIEEWNDLFRLRGLWLFWGWLDVRQRYRRSLLGPLWVTMTMGVSILVTGFVYAYLFKQDVVKYMPYVASGFILWSLISGYIMDACSIYIQNEKFITQVRLPLLIYPVRLLWKYLITFFHHLIVLLIVLLLFCTITPLSIVASIIGFFFTCLNLLWIGIVLGFISTRLRDVPILVTTVFQVLFIVTPIIWPASALGRRINIANWNPFYHLMEVIRSPLINGINHDWYVHLITVVCMAVFGMFFSLFLLNSWKNRLVYWL